MIELTIVRGEEFKAVVKEVKENDIFIEEYKNATGKLNDIVYASRKALGQPEDKRFPLQANFREDMIDRYENNIIAFCGGRGEGKSSAMMTFLNEVQYRRFSSVLPFSSDTVQTYFASPIIIDPSVFDGVHNVLDIVLAKLFQRFRMALDDDNQCVDNEKREELVQKFQSVYRHVSLINDEKKMLDDEYDYEGNISKLKNLGASTNLKNEFNALVNEYLDFMKRWERKEGQTIGKQLIIAIDDLDLCSKNAYRMTEQIRKYMVLPNVIIIMAIKLDQLELCIEEANRMDFKMVLTSRNREKNSDNLDGEFFQMSERYAAKLIPKSRRIYLPKANSFKDIHVMIRDADGGSIIWDSKLKPDIVSAVLTLLHEKTGMYFLKNENNENNLIPDNLRELLNFISILASMDTPEPEDQISFCKNIVAFRTYIETSWLENNFVPFNVISAKEMLDLNGRYLHYNIKKQLEKLDRLENEPSFAFHFKRIITNNYSSIIKFIETSEQEIYSKKEEQWLYFFRILYTIKLNMLIRQQNFEGFLDFIQGYIWGMDFSKILPRIQKFNIERSRFPLRPDIGFDVIIIFLNHLMSESLSMIEVPKDSKKFNIDALKQDDKREKYIISWIILGILSNMTESEDKEDKNSLTYKSSSIIFNNRSLVKRIQISLENYLISLCNLDSIYEKVNLSILGVGEQEFHNIIEMLKRCNEKSITCAKTIASNVDLAISLKNYCQAKNDYKESTDSALERSEKLVERFFDNIEGFSQENGVDAEAGELKYIHYRFNDGEELSISICELYSRMIEACVEDIQTIQTEEKENQIKEFRNKISNDSYVIDRSTLVKPAQYFRNRNAKRIKEALDRLADTLNYIRIRQGDWEESFAVEAWVELYTEVIEACQSGGNADIDVETANRYKELAAKLDYNEIV